MGKMQLLIRYSEFHSLIFITNYHMVHKSVYNSQAAHRCSAIHVFVSWCIRTLRLDIKRDASAHALTPN